jgi:hypothetical protein
MNEDVVQVICRLLTDEEFRNEFTRDAKGTLKKSGYVLSKSDVTELSKLVTELDTIDMRIKIMPNGIFVVAPYGIPPLEEK